MRPAVQMYLLQSMLRLLASPNVGEPELIRLRLPVLLVVPPACHWQCECNTAAC